MLYIASSFFHLIYIVQYSFSSFLSVYMHARKSKGSGVLRLKMAGEKLKNVEGMFSKSDPFFEIARKINAAGGQTWDNVYRSEFIKNNLNPEWKDAVIDLSILCEGDCNLPITISVFDHESKGNHTPMGQVEVSFRLAFSLYICVIMKRVANSSFCIVF